MMDEYSRLLGVQEQVEKESANVKVFGLGLNETMRVCLMNGLGKRAEKLKSDFRVPDKRYFFPLLRLPPLTFSLDSGISNCKLSSTFATLRASTPSQS